MNTKKIPGFFVLLCCFFFLLSCKNKIPTFSSKKLKSDFELFRHLLELTHPNLYLYTHKKSLDSIFQTSFDKIDGKMDEIEFYKLLRNVLYHIHCGHTEISLSDRTDSTITRQNGFFPLTLKYTGQSVVVISTNGALPFGSRIYKINDVDIKDILYKVSSLNYRDGSNMTYRFFSIENNFNYDYFLHYGFQKKFIVEYADSNQVLKKNTIEPVPYVHYVKNDILGYYKASDIDYDFEKYIEDNTARLTINTFMFNSESKQNAYYNFIDNCFDVLFYNKIKNLIIDLRDNTGGTYRSSFYLYDYLSKKRLKEQDSAYTKIRKIPYEQHLSSDNEDIDSLNAELKNDFTYNTTNKLYYQADSLGLEYGNLSNTYTGAVFILINENTFSAASVLAAALQDQNRAVIVGLESGTNYFKHSAGKYLNYILPNSKINLTIPVFGYVNNFTNAAYKKADCLQPNIKKYATYKDILKNHDTELIYIIDSLLKK